MTNATLEQALVNWLLAVGVTAPVQAGASDEELANDQATVIVSAPEIQHVVGPLHKATIHLIVSAPAYHASLETYREKAVSVRIAVEAHPSNGLAAALQTAGFVFGGFHIGDSSELVEDSRWVNSLTASIGLHIE
jgi:hypothetical protein